MIFSLIKHENIVEFIGIVISPKDNKVYMITELMDCDLSKVMEKLTYDEKTRVAKEVATGM